MSSLDLDVDADIRRARTPAPELYLAREAFDRMRERVLAPAWHWIADAEDLETGPCALPRTLLPGALDEPLVLTRDERGLVRALSNVCTHRGALVCTERGQSGTLRCAYHGRRFALDGKLLSMPEFEGVVGFPSPADDLERIACERWRGLWFASLAPSLGFDEFARELERRVGWMELERAKLDRRRSRDFTVRAHWALYCENFLEGFHVPYVHPKLSSAIDFASYRTELAEHGSVQIALARDGEAAFDPPATSPDRGLRVAGYYFFLFPTTLINVYPWGVSLNVVQPLAIDRTRVRFRSYVLDASRLDRGAGGGLFDVELEDERVVESVQACLTARTRKRGRYSPSRETGVHHFHRLLARALA